ncbi:MAG TPA: DUF3667 domain-containing protein [Novosphingobium sp.]|nr:DUF3667 domain-containing protein [Novosphingobium sp.]
MSGGEIIGDIAQGAMIARVVEPAHGEGADGHTHKRACLNCTTPLIGSHCHACGQAAHVHRTIGAFFHDLLHGVFHFEGKIWRTLPLLAWRPGQLTREYIDGRRASYVSPIALFLFVVFMTFALFNLVSTPMHFDKDSNLVLTGGNAVAEKRIAELKQDLEANRKAGKPIGALEQQIAGAEMALAGIRAGNQPKLPAAIAKADTPADQNLTEIVNREWTKATANPELALYKLQSSAYKYSWLLIPLSVPFVWLLFPFRRRFHLYDHTVFVTYSLSFMLIALAAGTAISVWTAADGLVAVLMFYVPFHMYRQLRGTYGVSRFGAIWRTWALMVFAFIALTLFAMAILGLSIG